jgi:hypothetical protein
MKPYRVKLNPSLVKRQGLTNRETTTIQRLHETRLDIEEAMSKTKNERALKILMNEWTMCQFELQKAWKFPEDINFHQFWTVPHCECPQLDNQDRYPQGPYVYNLSCPVHGVDHTKLKTDIPLVPLKPKTTVFRYVLMGLGMVMLTLIVWAVAILIWLGSQGVL